MEPEIRNVATSRLNVEVEIAGPPDGPAIVLLHGWPDSLRTWDPILGHLHEAGMRTVVPSLRGFSGTTFRHPETPRGGQVVVMVRDMFETADALGVGAFCLVGHDWGARIVSDASILEPRRLTSAIGISIGWKPGTKVLPLSPPQAQAFWYQWYFATKHGEIAFRQDPETFCRYLWETWSPPGWFTESEWGDVTSAWANPDWADVVIHFYRSRWRYYQPDPNYEEDEKRVRAASHIEVPTRIIHGAADSCCLSELAAGCEPYYRNGYDYDAIRDVGHFPQREAPEIVAAMIINWERQHRVS
ncbi:MAG: alpha/beta fold hydrolase [Hyphomicrobiaceae bacterium]